MKYYQPKIEIWKDVVGYEKLYEVSNLGNIKRKVKNLSKGKRKDGYNTVSLCKKR